MGKSSLAMAPPFVFAFLEGGTMSEPKTEEPMAKRTSLGSHSDDLE